MRHKVTWIPEPGTELEGAMRLGLVSSTRGLQVLQAAICATPTHPTCTYSALSASVQLTQGSAGSCRAVTLASILASAA